MVIAEALRSEQIFPGGVYRSDQPDHRKTAALTENEISELGDEIKNRKDEREQREREDPTAGHRR